MYGTTDKTTEYHGENPGPYNYIKIITAYYKYFTIILFIRDMETQGTDIKKQTQEVKLQRLTTGEEKRE